jgi:hypothetical protein
MLSLRKALLCWGLICASPALAVDLITVANRTEARLTVFVRPTNAPPQLYWRRVVIEPGRSEKIGIANEDPYTMQFYVPMGDGTVNNYGINTLEARRLMRRPSGSSQLFNLSLELLGTYHDFQAGQWQYAELHSPKALTLRMVAMAQRMDIEFGLPADKVAPQDSTLPSPSPPETSAPAGGVESP